jgi:hypothetical protein
MDVSGFFATALSWISASVAYVGAFATREVLASVVGAILLLAVLEAHWRNRRLHAELRKLTRRVAALEAVESSRFLQSLNARPVERNVAGLPAAPHDENVPLAPNIIPLDGTAQSGTNVSASAPPSAKNGQSNLN